MRNIPSHSFKMRPGFPAHDRMSLASFANSHSGDIYDILTGAGKKTRSHFKPMTYDYDITLLTSFDDLQQIEPKQPFE